MAEYDGRMYLTDWYNKSVQVFTPSKMEIVFGEETHITSDAVFKYDDIQPLGLLAYGGELLMSVQKSGKYSVMIRRQETCSECWPSFRVRRSGAWR